MKIKQHVYFGIRSEVLLPDEIARRVGLQPDRVAVRGSRIADPPRPASNMWQVRCDDPGLCVDEQVARVMSRLEPYRSAIRELVKSSDKVSAWLQVVRYLGFEDGEEEVIAVVDGLEKLAGQHQLLGWHLDRSVLEFVWDLGAELDVDEYGYQSGFDAPPSGPSDRVFVVLRVTSAVGLEVAVAGPFVARVRGGGEVRGCLPDLPLDVLRGCQPVRSPGVYRRQRHMPGRWFSTTTCGFLEYESLLERDWMLLLDFDREVGWICEQPLHLHYAKDGAPARHVPDLLVWRRGTPELCDVKTVERVEGSDLPGSGSRYRACVCGGRPRVPRPV